jgi:hypothetical protein
MKTPKTPARQGHEAPSRGGFRRFFSRITRESRLLAIIFATLFLVQPGQALAWWEYGHETIARIAFANVKPQTQKAIVALLRHAPELETPGCPANSIAQASVWPDCIKTLGDRFSYQYNWHYQNVDICKPFDLTSACANGNCVSAQIDRNARLLADKSLPARERVMAIAFLVHFVGDLHQPLHAGDHGDQGGNKVKSDYGIVANPRLNLHSIWDGYLAERAISQPPPMVRTYSADEKTRMAVGTTEDWSRESWALSRDEAYRAARGGDICAIPSDAKPDDRGAIDEAEIAALVPRVRLAIEEGGLRLARMLDAAFAPK